MIGFCIGLLVGGFVGVTMMCLFQISKPKEKDDVIEER